MLNIRKVTYDDLDRIVEIELACFPKEEAANREALKERITVFPEGFLVADLEDKVIGFINGSATNRERIIDPMFESMAEHHVDEGSNLAIYGVDIHPDYQGNGYSRVMMEVYTKVAKQNKRKKIILTCKEQLVSYYEFYGYECKGISNSIHGGAKWYDMILEL